MSESQPDLVARYKTIFIVWAALLMSQLMMLFVVFVVRPELFQFDGFHSIYGPSAAMVLGFAVVSITCVIFSFAFKKRFFQRAEEEQKPDHIQTGLIIACALCESSTLLGLTLAIGFGYQYFFVWFIVGILGILLHFPKQSDMLAAGYRQK